eukprot:TRINITY_DN32155_c0_g1_i1.p1 TRINITY_DN32155_c0_g1~~TRINITY_DN32155_c0_g1_i1.p1  ORF type:complete len:162 (-),score=41.40 TRINITY_DN32155_c0_g1_i1:1-423(-)
MCIRDRSKGVKLLRGFASIVKTRGKGLLQNVQNILPGSEKSPVIVQMFEAIVEGKNTQLSSALSVWESSNQRGRGGKASGREYNNCIVFVVEGGSYIEYQNLLELSKKLNKKVIYGASNIFSAKEYLNQFKEIQSIRYLL